MESSKLSTIFIGTPAFAAPILESLLKIDYLRLNTIITQPDKAVGRKKIITPPPVKVVAQKHNLEILQPEKIKDLEFLNKLNILKPDLIVVAAYGKILPKEIIEMPKYGCINIHTSLLPKYRGASPIQTAILNGEEKTGVTMMKMDQGMDTGDVISQAKIEIADSDTSQTLHDKLSQLGAKLLIETLPDYLQGKLKPVPQNNDQATETKILAKDDGKINFNQTANEIERQLRAFTPWPGIYSFFNNKKIKLLKLKVEEQINPLIPIGKLYEAENKLVVNCSKGALIINEIQVEGKKAMSGKEFINGYLK